MANDRSRTAKILALAGAIAIPGSALAVARTWVESHPIVALVLLLAYELVLAVVAFAGKVISGLQSRWSDRAISAVDSHLQRRFSKYGRAYRQYLYELNHDMDLKGLATQGSYSLSIEQVFVDVGLSPESLNRIRGQLVDDNTALSNESGSNRFSVWEFFESQLPSHRTARRRERAVAAAFPLAILGAPGGGKTTLLKHMTLMLSGRGNTVDAKAATAKGRLPVLLLLRQHAETISKDPSMTLVALIRKSVGDIGVKEPSGWLERQLAKRRCVVMLDGLDEVGSISTRRIVVEWVERQIAANSGNWFVITSRPYGYRSSPLGRATVVQVRAFTEDQILAFVNNWYNYTAMRRAGRVDAGVIKEASDGAADLIRKLRGSRALSALAVNPLLLTMMANVHNFRGALPGTRAELYREICLVFLARRQEAKQLSSLLSGDQCELVLRYLAFKMMESKVRDVDQETAAEIIGPVLADISETMDPAGFLDLIETSAGLLQQGESGSYQFAHLTFQEYLASTYIAEKGQVPVLIRSVEDEWWRETTLLYVAQFGANEIVESCVAGGSPSVAALVLAANCADEARELRPPLRRRLDELLSAGANSFDRGRREATATVDLTRKYNAAVRIAPDVWICPTPVTVREARIFMHDFDSANSNIPTVPMPADMLAPAVGMQRREVHPFLQWANDIIPGARLPTSSQLQNAVDYAAIEVQGRSIWVKDESVGMTLDTRGLPVLDDLRSIVEKQFAADTLRYRKIILEVRNSERAKSRSGSPIDADQTMELGRISTLEELAIDELPESIQLVLQLGQWDLPNAIDLADIAQRAKRADRLLSGYSITTGGLADGEDKVRAAAATMSALVLSAARFICGDDQLDVLEKRLRATERYLCGRIEKGDAESTEDLLAMTRLACGYLVAQLVTVVRARPDYGGRIGAPHNASEASPWDVPVSAFEQGIYDYCYIYAQLTIFSRRLKGALPYTETVLLVRD